MIDTFKIYSAINNDTYNKIRSVSDIKTSYNLEKNECYYQIVTGKLEGSYDTNLHINVDER